MLNPHATEVVSFTKWICRCGTNCGVNFDFKFYNTGCPERIKQENIELGCLTMEYSLRESGYTISVPASGKFVKNLRGGGRELLRTLRRQKYQDMLENVILIYI